MTCFWRRRSGCDCATCCDGHGHKSYCATEGNTAVLSVAEEVAMEDGYIPRRHGNPSAGEVIRLPDIDEKA